MGLGNVKDGAFISDMLIHLGPVDGYGPESVIASEEQHHWTCRHHDVDTGNCRVYDQRPAMCRDYPYGRSCPQPECTADVVSVQLLPPPR
jgi:Fe-S-cluster containining protein